jgi:hypothetical protein
VFEQPVSPNIDALPAWRCAMAIDNISADRAAAADRREAARTAAQQYLAQRADARRDVRIEESRASAAARPTPADRAAQAPARMVDILV